MEFDVPQVPTETLSPLAWRTSGAFGGYAPQWGMPAERRESNKDMQRLEEAAHVLRWAACSQLLDVRRATASDPAKRYPDAPMA